jgi:hypothetical protein
MGMENHSGMISTGETPDRPPELSGYPTSSHLVEKKEELAKEIMNICLTKYLFYTSKDPLKCRKIIRHGGRRLYFPQKEGVLRIFSPLIHRHHPV